MAPRHSIRRLLISSVGLFTLGALLVGCGGATAPKPSVAGLVSFDNREAVFANDPIERADQRFACGSRDFSLGQELITLDNPALAHVQDQWGDVVPGKSVFMTGKVNNIQGGVGTYLRGGADFLLTHPFGTDFTFQTVLDPPFKALGQTMGTLPLQQALGNPDIDILSLIKSKVGPDLAPIVERDPVFDCYDPLVVSAPGPASGSGVVVNADQPYPFYGQATVSWSK